MRISGERCWCGDELRSCCESIETCADSASAEDDEPSAAPAPSPTARGSPPTPAATPLKWRSDEDAAAAKSGPCSPPAPNATASASSAACPPMAMFMLLLLTLPDDAREPPAAAAPKAEGGRAAEEPGAGAAGEASPEVELGGSAGEVLDGEPDAAGELFSDGVEDEVLGASEGNRERAALSGPPTDVLTEVDDDDGSEAQSAAVVLVDNPVRLGLEGNDAKGEFAAGTLDVAEVDDDETALEAVDPARLPAADDDSALLSGNAVEAVAVAEECPEPLPPVCKSLANTLTSPFWARSRRKSGFIPSSALDTGHREVPSPCGGSPTGGEDAISPPLQCGVLSARSLSKAAGGEKRRTMEKKESVEHLVFALLTTNYPPQRRPSSFLLPSNSSLFFPPFFGSEFVARVLAC